MGRTISATAKCVMATDSLDPPDIASSYDLRAHFRTALTQFYKIVVLLWYPSRYSRHVSKVFACRSIPIDLDVKGALPHDVLQLDEKFYNAWISFMSSLTAQWYSYIFTSLAMWTMMFWLVLAGVAVPDPLTLFSALLSVLLSLNSLICSSIFFFSANEARSYAMRDASGWIMGALRLSNETDADAQFVNLANLCAAPAASLTWASSSTSCFFFLYVRCVYYEQTVSGPADIVEYASTTFQLPPAALIPLIILSSLAALHTIVNAFYFTTLHFRRDSHKASISLA
ncbi:hypothetical protein NM688_g3119 [Phlebia brevispora]|uniref:Uncharacterized protein n=1 Tax=Phlebia brevispora TaxID=194682 RepID=A0ACC1T6E7_9APHY|nr:hypothetical protein NM688_g3119 [Phlebia brevispora]